MTAEHELPIDGYDELPEGDLQHRIRSLNVDELNRLLEHERDHAHRAAVETMLEERLASVRGGAERSPGGPQAQDGPPQPRSASGESPVDPSTAAEPSTPLRHGVAGQTPNRG